jgi:hypothetical protein
LWDSIYSQNQIKVNRLLKDADQLKDSERLRISELANLVEDYKERYVAGTASLEALVGARAALLDAKLDAAEKHEERVALLEEAAKSDAQLSRVAEAKRKACLATTRSIFLDAKIRLLRQRGLKEQVEDQIKAAQKEQIEALTERLKIDTELEKTDWTQWATLCQSHADLVDAQVNAAQTSEAKILVLTKAMQTQTEYLRITDNRFQAGRLAGFDADQERSRLLGFKIRLLRERALHKARK